MGNNITDNRSYREQISHAILPDESSSTSAVESACDYVLQYIFKIPHIAGSVNTAADYVSKLELKVTEKIHFKIREGFQTTPIEVTTSSPGFVDEEQFFFIQADSANKSEQQTPEQKS